MPDQLLLLRHGYVDGIDPPRFRGRVDIPLSRLGVAQAAASADYLSRRFRIDKIYTSPLSRCRVTAGAVSDRCATNAELEVLPDLTDFDYGDWQGRLHAEVRAAQPEAYAAWHATPETAGPPNGETLELVAARAAHALAAVEAHCPSGCVLLVSHNSTMRLLLLQALGLPVSRYWHLRQDPCGVSLLERDGDHWTIGSLNETAHLAKIAVEPLVNS